MIKFITAYLKLVKQVFISNWVINVELNKYLKIKPHTLTKSDIKHIRKHDYSTLLLPFKMSNNKVEIYHKNNSSHHIEYVIEMYNVKAMMPTINQMLEMFLDFEFISDTSALNYYYANIEDDLPFTLQNCFLTFIKHYWLPFIILSHSNNN